MCDTNYNYVIDENEWAHFVYQVASRASGNGFEVPPMNEQLVRNYYYAFNQVYNQHPGISQVKLSEAIVLYQKYEKQYEDMLDARVQSILRY